MEINHTNDSSKCIYCGGEGCSWWCGKEVFPDELTAKNN